MLKNLSFILFFFISILQSPISSAGTITLKWNNLDRNESYILNKLLPIEVQDPATCAGGKLVIQPNQLLLMLSAESLPYIPVTAFTFSFPQCGCPNATAEVMLVNPETGALNPSDPVGNEVGVSLTTGCRMQVFVENKQLNLKSFFEK